VKTFKDFYNEQNVAGGANSVFGTSTAGAIGATGNQFPSQTDRGFNEGDFRLPKVLGAKRKKRKEKLTIQRRPLPGLEM